MTNSPLYNLRNKKNLSRLLHVEKKDLLQLGRNENYKIFSIFKHNKHREVQTPTKLRQTVHKRLFYLLSKLETPSYSFTSKKGKSYKDNASYHTYDYVMCADIENYYVNCKRDRIYTFFNKKMNMSPDVAWLVTDLVSYGDHIPTGSCLSAILSFWINIDVFNNINSFALSKNIKFSVYVDDLTFSCCTPIQNSDYVEINHLLKQAGLSLKHKKKKIYSKSRNKTITGVVKKDQSDFLDVPMVHYKEIKAILKHNPELDKSHPRIINRLYGKLNFVRYIKKNAFPNLYMKIKDIRKNILKDK